MLYDTVQEYLRPISMDASLGHRHADAMLRVALKHVHPDKVDALRSWLDSVGGQRRAEALATLVDEGCRHEMAMLIEGRDGPVVVYVMEVDDVDASRRAAERSTHPIDAEHRQVMQETCGDPVEREVLLDLHP